MSCANKLGLRDAQKPGDATFLDGHYNFKCDHNAVDTDQMAKGFVDFVDGLEFTVSKLKGYETLIGDQQSRLRKFEQIDKWSFCLTAGTLVPANQERR